MRNSPVVEGAWADDLAAVLALVRAADLPTEGIASGFPDAYAVVRDGAEVVAVAGLETYGTYGLLRSLAVARSQRGAGLGRLLVVPERAG